MLSRSTSTKPLPDAARGLGLAFLVSLIGCLGSAPGGCEEPKGELLVRFEEYVTEARRDEILRAAEGRVAEALPLVPGLFRIVVCIPVDDARARLERYVEVRYAEPNSLYFTASPPPGAG